VLPLLPLRMSLEKSDALVLRLVEWSETSYVVTLLTRDFGRLTAVAKGARRPKNPFDSALDLLAACRVVFVRKSSGALDVLTEARLRRRFRPAGGDLQNLYAGYYVAELLLELTDDYDALPELFEAADAALEQLCRTTPPAVPLLRFELAALRCTGFLPALEQCVECGTSIRAERRVAFGLAAGGVLCPACRSGKRSVVSLSAAAWHTMRTLAGNSASAAVSDAFDPRWLGELRAVLNQYVAHTLGHRPKMHRYLSPG
jgi:DNA repair protein RecO (recombination protein O)